MAGESMRLMFDGSCLEEMSGVTSVYLPAITARLCQILTDEKIAEHIINKVKIGEKITITDREYGRNYRIEMQCHSVCILGIYERNIALDEPVSLVYMPTGKILQLHKKITEDAA